ncbi:MAG TPA: hypothetical protein VOA87_07610 [Thermoanaerobaculia bacterium]|nr:hypothetical protein [Thermoanaerobaculia bacterium]
MKPTKEEQEIIVKLAVAIYANLMGTLDSEEKLYDYNEGNEMGTEIYRAAAREAFHRAGGLLPNFENESSAWKPELHE